MFGRARLKGRPSPPSQREATTFLVLFLLAVLPYLNSLFGDFVYDDHFQIVDNPYVHSFRYLRQIFGTTVWSFQGAAGRSNYYRPLMTLGYLLCYRIGGPVPFSFHLASLILNAIAVWLAFVFLRRLGGERVALVAAGLFALHPVHTESVAWIAAVTDLELAVFYLLTFLLYLRLSDPGWGRAGRIAMCGSYVLALLSKEQAMTLPVLATLFEHFFRDDREVTSARQKLSRYGPLWIVLALYITVRFTVLGGIAGVRTRSNLSLYEVSLSAVSLIGGYLGKLVWPVHLSAYYVFHEVSSLGDRGVLLGLAGLALCAGLFAVWWSRERLLSFSLVWMLLTIAPVLNVHWMPTGVFAERYLYLPSMGFCWILGWAAVRLWSMDIPAVQPYLSRAVPVLLTVLALLYGVKTVTRNRDWRTDEAVYRSTLAADPNASVMHTDLATVLFNRGDWAGAEREWLEALAGAPNNVFTLDNLGMLRGHQHRYIESLDYSWRALRERPAYTVAHLNLAETLAAMGRHAEAEWQFRIATALSPLSARAHTSYGKFLGDEGRLDDAQAEYARSVAADPSAVAYDSLGDIYRARHDHLQAESAFRQALELDRFDAHAHFGLGEELEADGRPGDALHEIELGLEMNPNDPVANAAAVRLRGANPSRQPALPR